MLSIAQMIVFAVKGYVAIGALAALAFLLWGIERVDARAKGAYAFRPLLAPGLVLLWPLVLWRWRSIVRG